MRVTPTDSAPVAGATVVLHRVTTDAGGPIDSASTDASGRYAFVRDRVDSGASYLVSVEHDGIAYFTRPVDSSAGADTAETLVVFDTSSVNPAIHLEERHVIVRTVGEGGGRRIIELMVLANRGRLTRITADTSQPVWQGALPRDAIELEVGESELSPQAVYRRGDSLAIAAPMPPGRKQLLLSYVVPATATDLVIPFDQPVARVNLLLEDTTATVEGAHLELRGLEEMQDVYFQRFNGDTIPAGASVTVRFAGVGRLALQESWWVVVLLAGGAMAVALWWWLRTHAAPGPAPVADPADQLAARIAALDADFEAKGAAATEAEGATYRREREELKRQLVDALASRHHMG